MSLQMDDGRLKCLPHPAESGSCEREGLTLGQASARGRLYRETFYVCRSCGREGETIERQVAEDRDPLTFSVRGAMKWGWGSAVVVVPLLMWMRWWTAAASIGGALVALPGVSWWENRKFAKALAARGLPRADAPGLVPIAGPTAGCSPETVIGRPLPGVAGELRATGPCCDQPDWIEAYRVRDEDRVPCSACRRGVMVVSEHAVH
jgi:hypothetical protein